MNRTALLMLLCVVPLPTLAGAEQVLTNAHMPVPDRVVRDVPRPQSESKANGVPTARASGRRGENNEALSDWLGHQLEWAEVYELRWQELHDDAALTNAVIQYMAVDRRLPRDAPECAIVKAKLRRYQPVVDALLVQSVGKALEGLNGKLPPMKESVARYLISRLSSGTAWTVLSDSEENQRQKQAIESFLQEHKPKESQLMKWYFDALVRAGRISVALPPAATMTDIRSVLQNEGYMPEGGWQPGAQLTIQRMYDIIGNYRWLPQGTNVFSPAGIYAATNPTDTARPEPPGEPAGPVTDEDRKLIAEVEEPEVSDDVLARVNQGEFVQRILAILHERGRTMQVPPASTLHDQAKALELFGLCPYDGWCLAAPLSKNVIREFMNRPQMRVTRKSISKDELVRFLLEALRGEKVEMAMGGIALTGGGIEAEAAARAARAKTILYEQIGTIP